MSRLLKTLQDCNIVALVLKLHHNRLQGSGALASFLEFCQGSLKELHLSHNELDTQAAAEIMLGAAAAKEPNGNHCYPQPMNGSSGSAAPLWLRLERNMVDPRLLTEQVEPAFAALNRSSNLLCSSSRCGCTPRCCMKHRDNPPAVHIKFLLSQKWMSEEADEEVGEEESDDQEDVSPHKKLSWKAKEANTVATRDEEVKLLPLHPKELMLLVRQCVLKYPERSEKSESLKLIRSESVSTASGSSRSESQSQSTAMKDTGSSRELSEGSQDTGVDEMCTEEMADNEMPALTKIKPHHMEKPPGVLTSAGTKPKEFSFSPTAVEFVPQLPSPTKSALNANAMVFVPFDVSPGERMRMQVEAVAKTVSLPSAATNANSASTVHDPKVAITTSIGAISPRKCQHEKDDFDHGCGRGWNIEVDFEGVSSRQGEQDRDDLDCNDHIGWRADSDNDEEVQEVEPSSSSSTQLAPVLPATRPFWVVRPASWSAWLTSLLTTRSVAGRMKLVLFFLLLVSLARRGLMVSARSRGRQREAARLTF